MGTHGSAMTSGSAPDIGPEAAGSAAIKPPAVAGMFYPADAGTLAAMVSDLLRSAAPPDLAAKAVVAPHAGYVYSGPIAATAYALLARHRDRIRRVVLLGPAHRVAFRGMAVHSATAWRTPLGDVALDRQAIGRCSGLPDVIQSDGPFAQEHSLEVHLPFLQTVLGSSFRLVPVLVGDAHPAGVAKLLETLWGGPETVVVISSDLSHFHDYDTAGRMDATATAAMEMLRPDMLKDDMACGRRPILGLLERARQLDLRATTLDRRSSGDTAGSRDRVVGYASVAFEYAASARLDDRSRALLLDSARASIAHGLAHGHPPQPDFAAVPRTLWAMRACFVSLSLDGALRGCVGSLSAQRPLLLDVIENAHKAAFSDRRFTPLTPEEADRIDIQISILSNGRLIPARGEAELVARLVPDIEGLFIRDRNRQALFLPSVWGGIPDPKQFLRRLKAKAGMPADHWSDTFQAQRFTAETFGVGHA